MPASDSSRLNGSPSCGNLGRFRTEQPTYSILNRAIGTKGVPMVKL
jgi:hypothetical protein